MEQSKLTQTEQVVNTMREIGGYAKLSQLYETVDTSAWGTKTPNESIRRIVQNSSAFYRIKPGLWSLADAKELVLNKKVDWSLLREGFQIPIEFRPVIDTLIGETLQRGESRNITIFLDGVSYDVTLKNQSFDSNKFHGHPDVVQIRYGINSPFAKRLREIFSSSFEYIQNVKNLPENKGRKMTVHVPEDSAEYFVISGTAIKNVFIAECFTASERTLTKTEIETIGELDFETFEPKIDVNASIKEVTRIQKVRQLDRSIGDSLKKLYNFTCQMTGEKVGEEHNALVVEAHHIVPFTQSMNNDTSNIIILSPSYHRIIHKVKPEFNREKLSFVYPNGLIEQVKLNKHL